MKIILSLLITVVIFASILSCSSRKEDDIALSKRFIDSTVLSSNRNMGDSVVFGSVLGERKFIRTANLKFKTIKLEDAISDIEFKSRALGGFVSFSHLQNSVQDSADVSVSPDSSLQIMKYRKGALLNVRVPDYRLESLLNYLSSLSDVMLNREISNEDVRIRMLANRLTNQQVIKIKQRLTADIDQNGKKLSEIEQGEKTLEEKSELGNNAIISNLTLDDAVNFSTVSIEIYQDPVTVYKQIAREKVIIKYQRPFLSEMEESLSIGWQQIKELIILLTQYWNLFVLLATGYLIYLKFFRSGKKMKTVGQ